MSVAVSVIVVSYNTRELTLASLRSLLEETVELSIEVLVVDNASTDGSADAIAAVFPQVRVMKLDRNVGFAAANNYAAREARGEFLLLLNPDTVVLDRAVERLHFFAVRNPRAGIFGGQTFFPDGSVNSASCWRRSTPWSLMCAASGLTSLFPCSRVFAPETYGHWARDSDRKVDIVSGCFLMIRRELWERLKGFDLVFFMYGEDADLCLRAAETGAECLICPDAKIIHYGGASERVRADKMVKLFQAKAQLSSRHWSPLRVLFGIMGLDLWALTRVVVFGAFRFLVQERAESYETWKRIWQRRYEWRVATDRRRD